ncbi:MAG: bifunctional 23S rRNA (guanine(2069)-N(7))-methyltransferase RlmK/23S rRNA (guanine(2445)-N(2))-methyltransferase RlmL [Planctomycetes bacterium]|nr:bifunctional 23S rRNA (guanine(2069)-N(7))-methyltransferase RlmK/23S rRNA (guanine(2445)-N(2))-methyltransferase RlmL [Planctomycetota bacterium]
MPESFEIVGKTLAGLEGVLANELAALGARDIVPGLRLVSFRGDRGLLYRVNLWCRTAIRFLRPIHSFPATNETELYDGISAIDWRQYLDVDGSLAIDPVVHNSFCTHSLYAAQLAKDAIVDQFRSRTGRRPSVDLKDPDLRINLHINQNQVTVHLDSSGDSLHKRGYRTEAGEAPISEVLAAGILSLTGWNRATALVDPMCGSGTFVIEAARLARNIAPGILRPFAFERWKDYDRSLHSELDKEARAAVRDHLPFEIVGSDRDDRVVEIARQNARHAGVEASVRFESIDFADLAPPDPPGVLVVNPPYDERMKVHAIASFYRRIGDTLKQRFDGYTAFVFSGNLEAAKHVGLRTSRRIALFNGPIECRLLRYEIRGRVVAPTTAPGGAGLARDQGIVVHAARVHSSKEPRAGRPHHMAEAIATLVGGEPDGGAGPTDLAPETTENDPPPVETTADPGGTAASCSVATQSVDGRVSHQFEMFSNRLRRMGRHWKKWAKRQGITCFRVYDRDIPDVPLAIDIYGDRLHVAEFERPHARTESEHTDWLRAMVETARSVLDVPHERVYFKQHRRQRGAWQYSRQADHDEYFEVTEAGHRFLVNLADYLDTGLFLDHRITRSMVQTDAAGKRFLNLFGYTGSFTVYAAAGGASSTTTVDLSQNYLDWTLRNMGLNGFNGPEHQFVCDDGLCFLQTAARSNQPLYDLAVVDPPTFSNSKGLRHDFDVQRDHVHLLELVLSILSPGGRIYFSTNRRKFRFEQDRIPGVLVREFTGQTVPLDFQRKRPHRCWELTRTGS